MGKKDAHYLCNECGENFNKWHGQCTNCLAWDTLVEFKTPNILSNRLQPSRMHSAIVKKSIKVDAINIIDDTRIQTNISEFDRVLGGGLVLGSVILIGGPPGVGKSSILTQTACLLSKQYNCFYVSGEESEEQIASRIKRMELSYDKLHLMTDTQVENILTVSDNLKPDVLVIDSIQTTELANINSAAGSTTQVRDSATVLTQYAKTHNVCIFLIGHITKSGQVAGPKVLEHIVDCVLYLEADESNRYRTLRSVKNRFGKINELGVFSMEEKGLKEVKNPSAIFLNRSEDLVPGSSVLVLWEGTRALLVEIQALVDNSSYQSNKRLTLGLDANRLSMLIAVLNKHAGSILASQDIYINVVGGMKVTETAIDLALILAVVSSLLNKPLPRDLVVFGEVGLSGEVRAVPNGLDRLAEASKHGFKRAIVPKKNINQTSKINQQMQIYPVTKIDETIEILKKF